MSSRHRILAIDQGTQSVRAIVFDEHGEIVARAQVAIDECFAVRPGFAEQHAEHFWQRLCDACRQLWQAHPDLAGQLSAVALTSQRGTVVCLDKEGQPLRPAISWLDQRRADRLPPLPLAWRLLLGALGLRPAIRLFQTRAQSSWLRQHEPEIWARTRHYMLLSGYLNWRLSGQMRDAVAAQVGYLPFDFRRQQWAAASDWKWAATAIKREQLPELVAPGDELGRITPAAAEATGLPAGLPVIAAGADKACEVVGSGAVTADTACLSYGTTATINTTSRRYVEAVRLLPAYPSPVPGHYCTEVQIYRGFWMIEWFVQNFAAEERAEARQRGQGVEALLEELAREAPPGAMGLMLQPYWTPGTREPGPEARGAIIGFGDLHTRAHVYRSILEGLVYALRQGGESIARRARVPIRELRVSGGGSRSDVAMQITADVFGLPAARPHTRETSALGAAITAAVGLGIHADFATAVSKMTRIRDVFQPQPANHEMYDQLYRKVYLRMYRRLQPLYHELRRFTGYPP